MPHPGQCTMIITKYRSKESLRAELGNAVYFKATDDRPRIATNSGRTFFAQVKTVQHKRDPDLQILTYVC